MQAKRMEEDLRKRLAGSQQELETLRTRLASHLPVLRDQAFQLYPTQPGPGLTALHGLDIRGHHLNRLWHQRQEEIFFKDPSHCFSFAMHKFS